MTRGIRPDKSGKPNPPPKPEPKAVSKGTCEGLLDELVATGCTDIRLRRYTKVDFHAEGRFGGYPKRAGHGQSFTEALERLLAAVQKDRQRLRGKENSDAQD